ncbi:MAG: 2,3-bisphosphoglycerate-independent phosphoglycerate mutase, partial [Zoogloeaceae bacterium]|nr:2,3-bisphosphoglycerate-independent phosphoglycerate mutase [Zoogloeaceae bacterium]
KTRLPLQNKDGSPKAKTSHTLNPVPLILYDGGNTGQYALTPLPDAGLANLAATVADLLSLEKHPAWRESLLETRDQGHTS